MQITIHLPDEIVNTIQEKWNNVPGKVVECLAIEAYRQGVITSAQVGKMLNLSSRYEVDSFVNQARAYLHYDEADFEQDLLTMKKLIIQENTES